MKNKFCDGIKRRDFLRVGTLAGGMMSGVGLNLAGYLQLCQAGTLDKAKAKSAIYIRLGGGPTHMDTFDLKPDAPSELRGEFKPISTNVAGIQISEHLPKLAQCADKFTLLRGVSHTLAAHELGTKYMNTGNRPLPSLEFPGFGAVVSKELTTADDLPPFVAIPTTPQVGGYLGIQYGAFNTNNAQRRRSARPIASAAFSLNPASTDALRSRPARKAAALRRHGVPRLRVEDQPAGRLGRVLRSGLQHDQLEASPRSLRHLARVGRGCRAVRQSRFRPELPAGVPAGRVGRALRHRQQQPLGHALEHLPEPQGPGLARARSGPGRLVHHAFRAAACWSPPWS